MVVEKRIEGEEQLSLHFKLKEFFCKCGKCDGSIPAEHRLNLHKIVCVLQQMRFMIDNTIIVTSGYRCPLHPASKDRPHSWHTVAGAADISTQKSSMWYLSLIAESHPMIGGLGYYPEQGFIHIDIRVVKTRWVYIDGKYITLPFYSPK